MKPFRTFLFLLILGLLAGCGKIPQTQYYSIGSGLPPAPAASSPAPLSFDVAVARFRAPQSLAQDRLLYRPGPNQVDYYAYHRWSGYPADQVTAVFLTRLRSAGLFRTVTSMDGAPKADYLLRGGVENLEEVNSGTEVSAHVVLSMEVVDTKTHTVVWSGMRTSDKPVADRSVAGVVRELNEGVRQCVDELTQGVAAHFRR